MLSIKLHQQLIFKPLQRLKKLKKETERGQKMAETASGKAKLPSSCANKESGCLCHGQ